MAYFHFPIPVFQGLVGAVRKMLDSHTEDACMHAAESAWMDQEDPTTSGDDDDYDEDIDDWLQGPGTILPPGVDAKSIVDGRSDPDWIFSSRVLQGRPYEELVAKMDEQWEIMERGARQAREPGDEESAKDVDTFNVMWDTGEDVVRVDPQR
jgi:hypothetical protein